MSFIPCLMSPLGFAFQAYQGASYQLPLLMANPNNLKFETIYKGHPAYDSILSKVPGKQVKQQIQPFLEKNEIRTDLIVIETPNLGLCAAQGTNLFKKGDALVMLAPGFYEKDKNACLWVMKHELSHLKNNDAFTMPLIGSISSAAAAVFGTLTLPWFSAALLTVTVGITVFSLFSQWREGRADSFAIENSSGDELLGGRRFLIAAQQMNLQERQTFWQKIAISSNGNNRFDILHPSLTSRIKKIEEALAKQQIVFDEEEETKKIKNLTSFIIDKKNEIETTIEKAGGNIGLFNLARS
jgi:hypothetical protein